MMRLARVLVLSILLFSGSSIATEDAPKPPDGQVVPRSKALKLSEFMPGSIFERMDLVIEIPAQYEYADLPFSSSTASFWMLPKEVKASASGELPGSTGYFSGLLSLSISYDTPGQTFIGFEDLKSVREDGLEILDFEQATVKNYPAVFLSFRKVGTPKTIYFAYIATLIETFVINIQYIPPDGDAKIGAEVWSRFRASLGRDLKVSVRAPVSREGRNS